MKATVWSPANPAPTGIPTTREVALAEIDEMIAAGEQSLLKLTAKEQERMGDLRRMRAEIEEP